MYSLNNFDPQDFLDKYWQKKPVLLKGLFEHFSDPIEPDELAGLAAEQEVESRVIARNGNDWQVEHGPFDDYSEFGENGWTLLVQAVDHWWEEGVDLVDAFRFIPNWRIDDLMVSFSTPNGGVGPHLDQYDVFIVQGQGKRHWRVGEQQVLDEKIPHPDLLQVSEFDACIDEVLEPGDVLYIPPGCPHEGYAIENALNYSIGFRAPNQQDLISSFADYALAKECFKDRYTDPGLSVKANTAEISQSEMAKIKSLMLKTLDQDAHFNTWLGEYMSQAKHELDIHEPEPHYENSDVELMLNSDEEWRKLGGLRTLLIDKQLYINGDAVGVSTDSHSLVELIAGQNSYTSDQLKKHTIKQENIELFTRLINQGYFYSMT
ncbi:cupin domain-containing protein [Algibacillus agarilyticus]|uniref:cupin domain-containing protein n=1 Tax=Algibacillus agarilyticus TaxID=2234133 RepID=UPI000DCFC0BD|nr:cupin domain-containing protein [Algibacillus agarilyticus]